MNIDIDGDDEDSRQKALSERRYILTIAKERISAMQEFECDEYDVTEWSEGYEDAKKSALAIIDKLINELT